MCVILFGTADQSDTFVGVAGCVSRVVVCGPFHKKGIRQHPQTGQQVEVWEVDAPRALQYIASQGIQFPNGYKINQFVLNAAYDQAAHAKPAILAIHEEKPDLSQQYVQSGQPYGPPYGSGGPVAAEPPMAGAPRSGEKGLFEVLPDIALARSQDGLLEVDEMGGTWMDIDKLGNEERRGDVKPIAPQGQR